MKGPGSAQRERDEHDNNSEATHEHGEHCYVDLVYRSAEAGWAEDGGQGGDDGLALPTKWRRGLVFSLLFFDGPESLTRLGELSFRMLDSIRTDGLTLQDWQSRFQEPAPIASLKCYRVRLDESLSKELEHLACPKTRRATFPLR